MFLIFLLGLIGGTILTFIQYFYAIGASIIFIAVGGLFLLSAIEIISYVAERLKNI
jgi:hypothetical protein